LPPQKLKELVLVLALLTGYWMMALARAGNEKHLIIIYRRSKRKSCSEIEMDIDLDVGKKEQTQMELFVALELYFFPSISPVGQAILRFSLGVERVSLKFDVLGFQLPTRHKVDGNGNNVKKVDEALFCQPQMFGNI